MSTLGRSIEESFAAVAFAEAGEHETALEIMQAAPSAGTVLVALVDKEASGILLHAAQVSRRIGARLDVMCFAQSEDDMGAIRQALSGQDCGARGLRLMRKSGPVKQAIKEYCSQSRDILFLVLGSEAADTLMKGARGISKALDRIGCPIVAVSCKSPSLSPR